METMQEINWLRRTGFSGGEEQFRSTALRGCILEEKTTTSGGISVSEDELLLPPVPVSPGDKLCYDGKTCRVREVRRCRSVDGTWRHCRCKVQK